MQQINLPRLSLHIAQHRLPSYLVLLVSLTLEVNRIVELLHVQSILML
jgi:hypothetical protein